MFAATPALPAAGNHRGGRQRLCAGPSRHARRRRLNPTARRRSDKPGAAGGHGSRIGEPSNNRAVGNTGNARSGARRDLKTQRISPDVVARGMGAKCRSAAVDAALAAGGCGDAVGRLTVPVTRVNPATSAAKPQNVVDRSTRCHRSVVRGRRDPHPNQHLEHGAPVQSLRRRAHGWPAAR